MAHQYIRLLHYKSINNFFPHYFFLVSKYLTLLIEINPVNNIKVIKAVDFKVKIQVGCSHFDNISYSMWLMFLFRWQIKEK